MKTKIFPSIAVAAMLFCATIASHAEDDKSGASSLIRVIAVSGTEITGLNSLSLTQEIEAVKASGATAVVLDLSRVERLTPAGLTPFERASDEFGADHVGLVGVTGQPRNLLSESGTTYRLFDSVEEATAAVK